MRLQETVENASGLYVFSRSLADVTAVTGRRIQIWICFGNLYPDYAGSVPKILLRNC